MRAGPQRRFTRRAMIRRSVRVQVRCGLASVGPAGAVVHACFALLAVASGPALCGADGDLEAFGGAAQGPAVLDDAAGEQGAASGREGGIRMGHGEDLWVVVNVVANTTSLRGLLFVTLPRRVFLTYAGITPSDDREYHRKAAIIIAHKLQEATPTTETGAAGYR